jgi:transcriptional regulator with XRE-family HTH domain
MLQSSESDELKRFGENLRRIRNEKNITMQQLANQAEIELSQIYRIESGKINPKLTTLLKIAKGLNVPAADLFPR